MTATVPWRLASLRADDFYEGDEATVRSLARGARAWIEADESEIRLATGSPRFDGEWFLIVHVAAAIGFGQTAIDHPRLRRDHTRLVERTGVRILSPRGRAHDVEAWGEDPLASLAGNAGHLAYLGYANLALSVHRRLDPRSRFASENDAMTEALARRFDAGRDRLLESYPGETYPADNAVAIASIALHDRALGRPPRETVGRALRLLARHADRASGLLHQRVDSETGEPRDLPRASGTAMAAFALGTADLAAARPYWTALARQTDDVLGFGGVREYPPGREGSGDVDSGPVVFGLSVSASGFALASARRFHDRARFRSMFASAWLLGLPVERGGRLGFAAGGPLGDALLFALLTAGSAE